jgi:ATP-binding cassette, subfamily C, bacterial EexD
MAEEARHAIWRATAMIATFSFFMHMLVLIVPLYSLQIYDRVLSSQSGETVLWLTTVAVFLIVILAVFDAVRARTLVRGSGRLEQRLVSVLLARNLAGDLGHYGALGTQGLDDLGALRRLLTGRGAVNLFDASWMPLYLAVLWLLNPWLGLVATVSAACLLLIRYANELATIRLGGSVLAGLMLAACAASAPMGSAETPSGARQQLYDCSQSTPSATRQVIAESADEAERLCFSPASGR